MCASRHSHQPRSTESTHPPGSRHQPPGRRPVTTPGLLSPTVELQLSFQRGQALTEKLQRKTDVEDSPHCPWVLRVDRVHLLHHFGCACMSAHAHTSVHAHACLHTHVCACTCTRLPRPVFHAEWFSFWFRLTFSCGRCRCPERAPLTCFQASRVGTPAGDALHVDTRAPRGHNLHEDTQAPCGQRSSVWTHKFHVDTSSAWTHKLHVDTISTRSHKLHVDTPPCSAWTHKLHVGRRASHGHTSFTWTHELCVDTSPCSTWLPLPLHLPGMPLPGSNTLSAGHPPDTWCRQAHGMVWGGHRKQ